MRLIVRAYAKINLELRLLGRRPDGYHEVRTVLQTLALHDVLTFRRRPGPFVLTCRRGEVPADRTNLVWRAAELVWRAAARAGDPDGLSVTLDKRIPVGAGLGGGSSDGAATLVACARLWRVRLPPETLFDLAASLGADVPFFLAGGTALGLGRGDEIYPLADATPFWVVVVVPPFAVATAEAYRWYDADEKLLVRGEAAPRLRWWSWGGTWALVNAFDEPVGRRYPLVAELEQALRERGAVAAALAGSGSAVVGLFERRGAAGRAARALRRTGHRVYLTRTLPRAAFQRGLRGSWR